MVIQREQQEKNTPQENPAEDRLCSTGISGMDEVLGGGLPADRVYLVQGDPGSGKTTMALQFLLEGIRMGEKGLYISLSETKKELLGVAQSHGWSLEEMHILELSSLKQLLDLETLSTVFHPSEVELNKTVQILLAEVERCDPTRVVFDSLSEIRLLAQDPLRYRRQMLYLKQFFANRNCTVLLLDDVNMGDDNLQVRSIAHGVLALRRLDMHFGVERRQLSFLKIRGHEFQGGNHDYVIARGGLRVFPRLIASRHRRPFVREDVSSGIGELDTLLGGGIRRGTSTLFIGPAGTGKSTLACRYALAAALRGEKASIFIFDETLDLYVAKAITLGMDLRPHLESGLVRITQINPAEMSPGEMAHAVHHSVDREGVQVMVLDSLNGYLNAMPQEKFLTLQLHELLTYLNQQGVVSILLMAQHGLLGDMQTPADITYLADTVVILRYFEAAGEVRKAISVIKKRNGLHEKAIRELHIGEDSIRIGPPLRKFHGVLKGVPSFYGPTGGEDGFKGEMMMEPHGKSR